MNKVVTAKKDGKIRKFPLIGLEKMGKDPNGETYDGWQIIDDIEDPAELKEAKAKRAAAKPKADGPKKSAKGRPKADAEPSDESQTVNSEENGNPETNEGSGAGSNDTGSEG